MGTLYICCSCDEHYGGDALACAKSIASGTKTPCACDCHKVKAGPAEVGLHADPEVRVRWWQAVAEAKQEERDKALSQVADLTARLEQLGALLAKIGRHTSWLNGLGWMVKAPYTPRGVVRAVEEKPE
jgi:hypothetical protein